ncbi:MAG: hypothetical protein ACOY82_04580 [Pseudomonadota bacterium]
MPVIDCTMGESLRIGGDIRLHLTGRVDEMLYVFIDAAAHHELDGVGGFHASAPSGIRRRAHILGLRDGESFSIGPADITVEAVRLRIPGVRALREVRLRIVRSSPLIIVRQAPTRPRTRIHRLLAG